MKKSLLIIAAAALVFAGCAENDTFKKDINEIDGENGGTIGFTSFTEKVTKAENSDALYSWTFFDHQESFKVWARKNNQPLNDVFKGTTVTVTREGNASPYTYKYTYSPDRYWDKLADNYNFYAAAPAPAANSTWAWYFEDNLITDDASIDKGYFKVTGNFALNGVNLQSVENGGTSAATKNVFKDAKVTKGSTEYKDVDLLMADETPIARAFYNKTNPEAVNLNFIHILSKLNITISTSLPTTGDNAHDVDLLAFEVKNVPNTGNFDENTANLAADKKWIRWTLDATPTKTNIPTGIEAYNATNYQIDNTKLVDVPYTNVQATNPVPAPNKTYIVESLIIPQEIKYQRVALDGIAHGVVDDPAVPFASYEAYEAARNNDATRLTAAQFAALFTAAGAFIADDDFDNDYVQVTGENIDLATFQARKADASATPATHIAAYAEPSEPYFTITYAIDDEVFTANYNLAAAFMNMDNDQLENDGVTDKDAKFSFFEGWQNTLNIIINPTAIKFTADVAEWSDNTEVSYEINE